MPDALQVAQSVIEFILARGGKDYTPVKNEIASLFDDTLWHGNWDATTDFGNADLPDLRFIQEDEYDQHMDDEGPISGQIGLISGHYVFTA